MRQTFFALVSLALLTVVLVPPAQARLWGTWDDRSYLTFSGPVSLPGVTLPADTYLFRFPSRRTTRSVIQVLSRDRTIRVRHAANHPKMAAFRRAPVRSDVQGNHDGRAAGY